MRQLINRLMLRSVKQLYGDKLGASDGEIGRVKDFYFDDQNWVVRYLVADTGSWLPGRKCSSRPMPSAALTGRETAVSEPDAEADRGQPFDRVAQAVCDSTKRSITGTTAGPLLAG